MLEVSLALGFRLRLLGLIVSKVKQGAKRSSFLAQRSGRVGEPWTRKIWWGSTYQGRLVKIMKKMAAEWTSLQKQRQRLKPWCYQAPGNPYGGGA